MILAEIVERVKEEQKNKIKRRKRKEKKPEDVAAKAALLEKVKSEKPPKKTRLPVSENSKKRLRRNQDGNETGRKARMYFNYKTQEAIVLYQSLAASQNRKEKELIYINEIKPAFDKLTENLINVYKFSSLHDSYDELKNDCVNFLFETIHKFNASRGTNAFSYFNVVAKNWLIIRAKQRLLKSKRVISLDDTASLTVNETKMIEEYNVAPSTDVIFEQRNSANRALDVLYEIRDEVTEANELVCINSIITIYENIDELDILNKSAIFLYMKELSGLTIKQINLAMQDIKKYYKRLKNDADDGLF